MPTFENFTEIQILKGIRAFLGMEAGIVRGASKRERPQDLARKKDREISRLRRELSEKDGKLARLRSGGSADDSGEKAPIFFVTGAGKSGTTWLSGILNAHPEILCEGEGRFFGRNVRNENFKAMQTNNVGQRVRPSSLYNALAEDEYLRLWIERTWWTRGEDVENQLADLTREAIRLFLTKRLHRTGKRIAGDKTPLPNTDMLKEINAIFPEAKVIHMIRDGRDVAVSRMHHLWNRERPIEEGGNLKPEDQDKRDRYRKDPEGFLKSGESIFTEQRIRGSATIWRANVAAAHRDGADLLGERYTEARYEDLLQDPEKEAARLFRFLGARAGEKVVRKCVNRASFEKRAGGRERGQEDSTSPVRKGIAGDWRNAFTERDRAIYQEVAGDLLAELGYAKDEN